MKQCLFTLYLSTVQHRGHQLKLYKSRSNLNLRKFWFSQRVVNYWNILPRKAIEASSVNIFKGHVDKFLKNVGGLYIYAYLSCLPQ